MKMLAIGLAKQAGADYCHAKGFGHMAETVPKFGRAIIQYSKLLFGLAIVLKSREIDRDQPMFEDVPKKNRGERMLLLLMGGIAIYRRLCVLMRLW